MPAPRYPARSVPVERHLARPRGSRCSSRTPPRPRSGRTSSRPTSRTTEESHVALQVGLVGLPNVGKSTLFNAVSQAGAEAANFPFCTIDPNVGVVAVPDARLDRLTRAGQLGQDRPHGDRVRRHRRARRRREPGRGPRQPVPRAHPRGRRRLPRRALLRRRRRRPRRRLGRPCPRHRDHRDRARPEGPRDGREARSSGPSRTARTGTKEARAELDLVQRAPRPPRRGRPRPHLRLGRRGRHASSASCPS